MLHLIVQYINIYSPSRYNERARVLSHSLSRQKIGIYVIIVNYDDNDDDDSDY